MAPSPSHLHHHVHGRADHPPQKPTDEPSGELSAVDFANTVACKACRADDVLLSQAETRDWIRDHGGTVPARGEVLDLHRLRRFRGDVRAVMDAAIQNARPSPGVVAAINDASRREGEWPSLRWSGGRWTASSRARAAGATQRVAGAVARSLIRLLTGPDGGRLGACHAPRCAHLVLVRTSQQLWCSPTCGNRVRVARHWRRMKSQSRRD